MTCHEVQERLLDANATPSLMLWAHLLRCNRCRAQARAIQAVHQALGDAGRYAPPADLLSRLLAVPQTEAPAYAKQKEDRGMRRFIFVASAVTMLIIGAAIIMPNLGDKSTARSILYGVAEAMEQARSLYAVTRVTESTSRTTTGLRLMPGHAESWLGKNAAYTRYVMPSGHVTVATAANLETGQVWAYSSSKNVKYVADLKPFVPATSGFLGRVTEMVRDTAFLSYFKQVLGTRLKGVKQSVKSEVRGGRKITVVTLSGTLRTHPRRVTDRWIFEIDPITNHLLQMHRYARVGRGPEQLVAGIDTVVYDAPLPTTLARMSAPADARVVRATASVKEAQNMLKLMVHTDTGETMRGSLPLPKSRKP